MTGSVPPFPYSPYAVKFCTGTNLSFLFLLIVVVTLVVAVLQILNPTS